MRPHNDIYEEFDDAEEFASRRSRAFRRLQDELRREERQRIHHRSFDKDRRHRNDWNWDDDDGGNPYVDNIYGQYHEDQNSGY